MVGLATPAFGAGATVDRQGWYWERNTRANVSGTGAQQEVFPASAQQHHLQVSLSSGREDKRAYVGFDVISLDGFRGSRVGEFKLVAAVSQPNDRHRSEHVDQARASSTAPVPPSTSGDAGAKIVACPVTSFLADGADGDPPKDQQGNSVEPTFDCATSGQGTRSADGSTWTFDLTRIAALWSSGGTTDTAVVLKPAPAPPQPPSPEATWTVEFHGRQLGGLQATVSYTPASSVLDTPAFEPPSTPAASESVPIVLGEQIEQLPSDPVEQLPAQTQVALPASLPDAGDRPVGFPWYALGIVLVSSAAFLIAHSELRGEATQRHTIVELLRGGRES